MDLHYLEYVIEIASTRSISYAAERLYITQSNLSQYLSRLENELGVKLFDRKKNEMVLTQAGELYVSSAKHMMEEKKELYNQLSDIAQARTGRFSLGITPQWGAVAFSNVFKKFKEVYPEIKIHVLEETAVPLIRALSDGQIDMAIIPLAENTTLAKDSILVQAEELILAIPKSHITNDMINTTASVPVVNIEMLAEEPFILSQSGTTIRKLENECFSKKHMVPNIVSEINSHSASLIMVADGVGTTFIPYSYMVPSDEIVYAHVNPLVQWFITIAFRKGFKIHPSEQYFIELISNYFKEYSSIESPQK